MVKKGSILRDFDSNRDRNSAALSNRQLWSAGIFIGYAWLELAADHERACYSELEKRGGILAAVNAAKPITPVELSKVISAAANNDRERRHLAEQLQESLLDRLFNGELHAYGYRIAPSRSGQPTRIAAELFEDPKLDWEESRLAARGLEFEDIKVLDPERMPNNVIRRKGRIGSSATIREAIKRLKNSNVDLCCMPRKEACNAVRREIGKISEIGLGLSNQNISKYILEFCPKRSLDKQ
jgi:hypothetical protein